MGFIKGRAVSPPEPYHPLRRYLYWSAGAHAAAFLSLLISPHLPFSSFHVRDERVTWINLPKGLGDQIGMGFKKSDGLPKSTIQEQKRLPALPKAAEKSSRMTYKKKWRSKKEKVKTEKQLKEEKRMEKILAQAGQQVTARKAALPEAAQIPASKVGGVPNGTNVGSKVPLDDPELLSYKLKIRQKIMDEWIPPLKFQQTGLGLICKLILRINERGEVVETEWEQKSGNEAYDLSALRAVQKSSPLEIPPEKVKWEALSEGFSLEFNVETKNP